MHLYFLKFSIRFLYIFMCKTITVLLFSCWHFCLDFFLNKQCENLLVLPGCTQSYLPVISQKQHDWALGDWFSTLKSSLTSKFLFTKGFVCFHISIMGVVVRQLFFRKSCDAYNFYGIESEIFCWQYYQKYCWFSYIGSNAVSNVRLIIHSPWYPLGPLWFFWHWLHHFVNFILTNYDTLTTHSCFK